MSNKAILKRIKNLEKVFAVEPKDDWIDVRMWNGLDGGIFGHVHCRFSKSRGETELLPCSDEEEIQIMRDHYEETEHKIPGRNERVSFSDFLEYYSFLSPEKLSLRRGEIIDWLKGGEDGVRVEDTGCRAC